ncbi:MAG: TM2 domain-containing protein [Bacteroidales bacterium]
MKNIKRLTLLLIMFVISGGIAFASFPYTSGANNEKSNTETVEQTSIQKEEINSPYSQSMDEDTIITLILAVFLGWLAAHRWYKHKPAFWNIIFMICVWSGLGAVFLFNSPLLGTIGFIWWLIDLIMILTGSF